LTATTASPSFSCVAYYTSWAISVTASIAVEADAAAAEVDNRMLYSLGVNMSFLRAVMCEHRKNKI